jgi:uncharacterized protein involved in exopolysaccharide biosynthesis
MTTFHRQVRGRDVVGRLLQSAWRYKGLIAAVALLGALLGYGWAARQPTLYQGVARVLLAAPGTSLPADVLPQPPGDPGRYLDNQALMMRSAPVLQRAVKLSGSRISVETLGQRLEVEVAQEADMLTVRVVDSTARGAAQLANAVAAAYDQVLAHQRRESLRAMVSQLRNRRSALEAGLVEIDAQVAGGRNDPVLQARRGAVAEQLLAIQSRLMQLETAAERSSPVLLREVAAVPKQPISPSPGGAVVIGMLVGLLAAAVLVWWRTRRQGPPSSSSASEPGPEMPSPA